MATEFILISACLLGEKVRYDAKHLLLEDEIIKQWTKQGVLIPLCPEVAGGLQIPRLPAEIQNISHQPIKVINIENQDVTRQFSVGAKLALKTCQQRNIQMAILTEGSPSCGSYLINDGSFSKNKIAGEGITTRLLRQNGIKVFNQHQLTQANEFYLQIITKKKED